VTKSGKTRKTKTVKSTKKIRRIQKRTRNSIKSGRTRIPKTSRVKKTATIDGS